MSETTLRDQELAQTANTVVFGYEENSLPITLEISALSLFDDEPSIMDYGDGTGEAGCIWVFEAEDDRAATLVYNVNSCGFTGKFSYCGNVVEGTAEQVKRLIEKLPENDRSLVAEWTRVFREGGMYQIWHFESDRMRRERAAKPF